ncbi:hypothetical protein DFQ27_005507 [Actinomortierella ambigua]|uniref:Transmembrane protein 18 n=1 Tax=Actinomortierella ambigua TaxID=1343610 RepID=A0A9P6PYW5_9FUNG|nr:hypothetical protein DFQ27_005507 [Actinomortierella ambigua]
MQDNSDTASPFWSDFWATIYHFTHPFSSTYFDQLFETQQAKNEGGVPDPSVVTNPTAHATDAKHFAGLETFKKYWEGLQTGHEPQTALEQLQASWIDFKSMTGDFINAVNWRQWWIQVVFALHASLFVAIILSRKKPSALQGLLMGTIALAALLEPLNRLGHEHWQNFSDDNYFDKHGVFLTTIWATPLLLNGVLAA